jgi:hypothetical protein
MLILLKNRESSAGSERSKDARRSCGRGCEQFAPGQILELPNHDPNLVVIHSVLLRNLNQLLDLFRRRRRSQEFHADCFRDYLIDTHNPVGRQGLDGDVLFVARAQS